MKKETKKLMVAGIVMALSCAAWGSVQATDYTIAIDAGEYNDDVFNMNIADIGYPIDADHKNISINSNIINITSIGTTNLKMTGADSWSHGTLNLGSKNTDEININIKNSSLADFFDKDGNLDHGFIYGIASCGTNNKNADKTLVNVKTKKLEINVEGPDGYSNVVGLFTNNCTDGKDVPTNVAELNVNADQIIINSTASGLSAFSNGQMNINGDLEVNAIHAIDARGNATINVNTDGKHKTVLNGDIVFETPAKKGAEQNSGHIIDANVNVNLTGTGSSWTGKSYQEYGDTKNSIDLTAPDYYGDVTGFKVTIADGAAWNMTGNSFINQVDTKDNGVINVQNGVSLVNIQNATLDNGTINLQGENQRVNVVEKVSGKGTVKTNSLTNKMQIEDATASKLTVKGNGAIADQIAADSSKAQVLADIVTTKTEDGKKTKSAATKVEAEQGVISGGFQAQVDDNGQVIANSVKEAVNTDNQAISNMATLSLMTWRQENNDMNKRLGELRASQGSQGVWARMARGQAKYGAQSIKNQYNYYQLGYDSKISDDWILGGAFTYTDGESSYTNGTGTNKHTGFAVYGSNLRDDGSFIDIIAKYAHMKNDFDVFGGVGNGDYSTNGYSFSAEYGKRFQQEGFWIEPQAELTYGKVSSVDFTTKNGAKVHQDSMDSLVGRLGFSLGKDIKQGNVYVRASYLYDFQGDTNVRMSLENGASSSFKTDLGGGWWEFGVGTNLNLGHDTHFYLDVETTAGGDVDTPWQWNAGVRFSF